MTPYFRECFVCGSLNVECGHRESDLVSWWVSGSVTVAPQTTEIPAPVVTTPEPAETPQSAPVEEIRQLAKELRRKRGWQ